MKALWADPSWAAATSAKISAAKTGKPQSKRSKIANRARSETMKAHERTPEHESNRLASLKGRTWAVPGGLNLSDEERQRRSDHAKTMVWTDEMRWKAGVGNRGKKPPQDRTDRQAISRARYWAAYPRERYANTKLERQLRQILEAEGIDDLVPQQPFGRCVVDFYSSSHK